MKKGDGRRYMHIMTLKASTMPYDVVYNVDMIKFVIDWTDMISDFLELVIFVYNTNVITYTHADTWVQ